MESNNYTKLKNKFSTQLCTVQSLSSIKSANRKQIFLTANSINPLNYINQYSCLSYGYAGIIPLSQYGHHAGNVILKASNEWKLKKYIRRKKD